MKALKSPVTVTTREHILRQAITLFAASGYEGVSMRHIASAVGTSAAALYHHFPDKPTLYLEAIRFAFADKSATLREVMAKETHPAERLYDFIRRFTQMVYADPAFLKLVHRELLDGDTERMKVLVTHVFAETRQILKGLIRELAPDWDETLLMTSIIGLVIHHYETATLRSFLPGSQPGHEDPETVARHVNRFIQHALGIAAPADEWPDGVKV